MKSPLSFSCVLLAIVIQRPPSTADAGVALHGRFPVRIVTGSLRSGHTDWFSICTVVFQEASLTTASVPVSAFPLCAIVDSIQPIVCASAPSLPNSDQ